MRTAVRSVAVTLVVVALALGFLLYTDANRPSLRVSTLGSVMNWDTYRAETRASVTNWLQNGQGRKHLLCERIGMIRGQFIFGVTNKHEFPSTTLADLERFEGWLNHQLTSQGCPASITTLGPL